MKHFLIILLLLLCAAPVMAIEYSQEYNTLQTQSVSYEHFIIDLINKMAPANYMWDGKAALMLHYDIERNNILLEKQNELQAELLKAQWVETCYAPRYTTGYLGVGNLSAWKSECANAGYTVG